jgi:hypothetical protein
MTLPLFFLCEVLKGALDAFSLQKYNAVDELEDGVIARYEIS